VRGLPPAPPYGTL